MTDMGAQYPDMTIEEAMATFDSCFGRDGGWWHSDGQHTYKGLFLTLVGQGFTNREAVEILESAYGAAANEYGG